MKLEGMTPEEWAEWYSAVKASLRHDAIRDTLNGMWRAPGEVPRSAGNGSRWAFQRNDWRHGSGGGTWPPEGGRESGGTDEFAPGAGLDIVKIRMFTEFDPGLRLTSHGSIGQMRLYAEMWRGTEHVRAPLLPDKEEEFVARLKEDGFTEIRNIKYHHYLWRKRT